MSMHASNCPICRAAPAAGHHACRAGLTWCPGDRRHSAEPGLAQPAQPFSTSSACTACGQPLGLGPRWVARLEPRRLSLMGLAATFAAVPASAQKPGGILKVYLFDSPASMLPRL